VRGDGLGERRKLRRGIPIGQIIALPKDKAGRVQLKLKVLLDLAILFGKGGHWLERHAGMTREELFLAGGVMELEKAGLFVKNNVPARRSRLVK
jgi:hypothetical protein